MATAHEVAQFMASHFETAKRLYQESAVRKIKTQFGTDFLYKNANGNWAINKDVLAVFRTLTEGKVVWERGDRSWRLLREGEAYNGRQKD